MGRTNVLTALRPPACERGPRLCSLSAFARRDPRFPPRERVPVLIGLYPRVPFVGANVAGAVFCCHFLPGRHPHLSSLAAAPVDPNSPIPLFPSFLSGVVLWCVSYACFICCYYFLVFVRSVFLSCSVSALTEQQAQQLLEISVLVNSGFVLWSWCRGEGSGVGSTRVCGRRDVPRWSLFLHLFPVMLRVCVDRWSFRVPRPPETLPSGALTVRWAGRLCRDPWDLGGQEG